ncbi:MAG: polymer-forming cytoskeletal protein [Acidobacteriota bacterium]
MTRISAGTKITGEISGDTELVVEGEVEGTLRVDARIVVGSSGAVRGEIEARSVLIAGEVFGDVRGGDRVEVGASGRLEGDISAPRVTIAEGAFFKGKVEMTGEAGRARRSGKPTPRGDKPEGAAQ